ncbi:VWA domain-containing protein [Actinokineospora pegani]|uniref:VWA domain-containing protein n=1 Tax=Actinokineospora pegani TaxID=2654637 RepID=UPI0012E9B3C8|nr:VWA domain-containing protein [Actinokineospora pegani]
MSLPSRLVELVSALRGHGVAVGSSETVDAAAVAGVLGLADRERLRAGLAAALLRGEGQRPVFDAVFDVCFPLGVGSPELARDQDWDLDRLRDELVAALADDDGDAVGRLAGIAVEAFGRYGGGFSAYEALERVRPQTLVARVLAESGGGGGGFTDRLERDEVRRRVESFREAVRTEARRRTAEARGRQRVLEHAVAPSADRVDFLVANRKQLAELRRAVQPLARKLATRLAARRRRANRGHIDIRRTLRRSLSTGGVPIHLAHRRRSPARPEIVLVCDLSGSVAGFANFTMLLVQALRDQFSKIRVFGFIDTVDEITHLVHTGAANPDSLGARVHSEATLSTWDGHSDYGRAFRHFAAHHADAIGPRTSVLILGDARTNGADPELAVLRDLLAPARHAHWLNPERTALWSTGDSEADRYATVVPMHECRNTRQLTTLVGKLLPT